MDFSAVLLAGGQSSRMGVDKAGLEIDNIPLWSRQVEMLRESGAEEIFISGRPDGPYAGSGLQIVSDDGKSVGPLSGLVASLQRARHSLLLVLAVDMPRMSATYLRTLFNEIRPGLGVVPERGGRFEPLAAIYPVECLALAERFLDEGKYALQQFVAEAVRAGLMTPRRVKEEEEILFSNINTPSDLSDFKARRPI